MESVLILTPRDATPGFREDCMIHAVSKGFMAVDCHGVHHDLSPEGIQAVAQLCRQVWVYPGEGTDQLCHKVVEEATLRGIPVYLRDPDN